MQTASIARLNMDHSLPRRAKQDDRRVGLRDEQIVGVLPSRREEFAMRPTVIAYSTKAAGLCRFVWDRREGSLRWESLPP